MTAILFVGRILVVLAMFYALHKRRKDWSELLGATLFLLTSISYSLDRNWFWAALQLVVMSVFVYRWLVTRKSN